VIEVELYFSFFPARSVGSLNLVDSKIFQRIVSDFMRRVWILQTLVEGWWGCGGSEGLNGGAPFSPNTW